MKIIWFCILRAGVDILWGQIGKLKITDEGIAKRDQIVVHFNSKIFLYVVYWVAVAIKLDKPVELIYFLKFCRNYLKFVYLKLFLSKNFEPNNRYVMFVPFFWRIYLESTS